jgi:hypothetical protein
LPDGSDQIAAQSLNDTGTGGTGTGFGAGFGIGFAAPLVSPLDIILVLPHPRLTTRLGTI